MLKCFQIPAGLRPAPPCDAGVYRDIRRSLRVNFAFPVQEHCFCPVVSNIDANNVLTHCKSPFKLFHQSGHIPGLEMNIFSGKPVYCLVKSHSFDSVYDYGYDLIQYAQSVHHPEDVYCSGLFCVVQDVVNSLSPTFN